MANDVLAKYYPIWIANLHESIRYIEAESDEWRRARGKAPYSADEKTALIIECRAKIVKYQALIDQQ